MILRTCYSVALLLGIYGIPTRVQAQSFNCSKASTAVERAICADKSLGLLDESLAAELKTALAAAPNLRLVLLSSERHWVVARDKQCASAGASEPISACLANAYRVRIAELKTGAVQKAAATFTTATCQKIADRYRIVADAHPGETPLQTLSVTPKSGITASQLLRSNGATARESYFDWARRQQPPFEIPEELEKQFTNASGPQARIEKLPNSNFYWVGTWEGTLHCYSSTYFVVRNGRAQQASAPPGFEGDPDTGDSCGIMRTFGTVDDDAVIFEEDAYIGPWMTASLKVATWDADRFPAACGMTFQYAPQFTREMKNDWNTTCNGAACEGLRQEAFRLAAVTQRNPADARKQALEALPPAQRAAYAAAEKLVVAAQVAAVLGGGKDNHDSDSLTTEAPLLVPLVYQGHLYVVSLGHFLMWDHVYPDWNVKFEEPDNGKLVQRASIAVGMRTGHLEDVSITPFVAQREDPTK